MWGENEDCSDDEGDTSKYAYEQVDAIGYVVITKTCEKQFDAMEKLVLGDQYGDG